VNPVVGIIMGSDSDLPTMVEAEKILNSFNIPLEITVVSAHRTVDRMTEYARSARDRGLKVIIAGAGGAAHLPGMVAAMTTLPVIGVPIKSSKLSGLDSLLSIVQMPGGIPVATVAIGGGKNAGLLAASILSASDDHVAQSLAQFRDNQEKAVLEKAEKLTEYGRRRVHKPIFLGK
jgi:phosphoribosylaminoimidazole carboxylase PurE protein